MDRRVGRGRAWAWRRSGRSRQTHRDTRPGRRPDRLHRLDALAHQLPARVERGAVVFHLLGVPATADTEEEPTVRDMIDRGDLFRRGDRIALNDKTDPGADLEVLGGGGRCGERHERIHRLVIHLRQVGAPGPRTSSAGRDVGVLGDPVRLEPTLLERRASSAGCIASAVGKMQTPKSMTYAAGAGVASRVSATFSLTTRLEPPGFIETP